MLAVLAACCMAGCAVYDEPPQYAGGRAPGWGASPYPYAEPDVVSVYVEPPLYEPAPIAVPWAPPPMLAEMVPPRPFPDAVWVGGYWVWQGRWVWATGRWAPRPRPDYAWVQPYYEHRDGAVIFIPGHWCPPGVAFVPPPPNFRPRMMTPMPGVRPGVPPMGPPGVFLPPPPGSRPGVIVPAPVGTPPSAVRGTPPPGRLFGTVPQTRPAPPPPVEASPPAGRPSWRGWAGKAVPPAQTQPQAQQEPPRERFVPREENAPAPRERGERGGRMPDRPPAEFQRRPAPAAPVQVAPAPAPQAAPPSPGGAPAAQPPARREEGPRRLMGPRGDRDRKDQKNE